MIESFLIDNNSNRLHKENAKRIIINSIGYCISFE